MNMRMQVQNVQFNNGVIMKKLVVTLFLSAGLSPQVLPMQPEDLNKQLLGSAMAGDLERIKRLVAQGVPIDTRDIDGETPLMLAAENNYEDTCKFLLDNGADVNARSISGETPLHFAAGINAQICILLLGHGADPRIADEIHNRTPITLLAWDSIVKVRPEKIEHAYVYIQIIKAQYKINRAIEMGLLCLNRIRKDTNHSVKIRICSTTLYRQFKKLLLPHLGNYVPLKQLLNIRDCKGRRAYDYRTIDWLNPDKVYEKLEPRPDKDSKCSIQ